jgi:hypothetical protein
MLTINRKYRVKKEKKEKKMGDEKEKIKTKEDVVKEKLLKQTKDMMPGVFSSMKEIHELSKFVPNTPIVGSNTDSTKTQQEMCMGALGGLIDIGIGLSKIFSELVVL